MFSFGQETLAAAPRLRHEALFRSLPRCALAYLWLRRFPVWRDSGGRLGQLHGGPGPAGTGLFSFHTQERPRANSTMVVPLAARLTAGIYRPATGAAADVVAARTFANSSRPFGVAGSCLARNGLSNHQRVPLGDAGASAPGGGVYRGLCHGA